VEELEKAKADLEAELVEQRRELDVSENDKTVLRDSLKQAETEKNGLALDLAETSKVRKMVQRSFLAFFLEVYLWGNIPRQRGGYHRCHLGGYLR
jgi:hypothetical protein